MVAAAIAAIALSASAEVVSSDVVGYAQNNLGSNANLRASEFDMVAGEGMDIQAIIPAVVGEEEFYSGGVQIQLVTSGMETEATYAYLTAEDAEGVDGVAEAGWFDEDWTARVVKTFAAGEGFVGVSDYDAASMQTSGKVVSDAQIITLSANANLCGNNRPVALDMQDVLPGLEYDEQTSSISLGDDFYSGCVQIQTVTSGMETEATYAYLTAEDAEGVDGVAKAGWFDEDWTERIDKDFAAGEGFVAVSDMDTAYIKLPGIQL